MVAINRGDNTGAFGKQFLKIYLNNPNHLYIQKAVFQVNGNLEKEYWEPQFPIKVNFTGEETEQLCQINECRLAVWDEHGRRRTSDGKFTFFVKENRIKQPDTPDENFYEDEDTTSITFSLDDPEFAAEFVVNATPTNMSELKNDVDYIKAADVIGVGTIKTEVEDGKVLIKNTLEPGNYSYNDLTNKPSINGRTLQGNIQIDEHIQSDWNSTGRDGILNKPTKLTDFENNLYPINRLRDYLYTIQFNADQVDYEYARTHFEATNPDKFGACSSLRNGNFYGRCYDWYYDESCNFIVHTKGGQGRYSSIGVSCGIPGLDEAFVKTGEWSDAYKLVPFFLLDGINEKGLLCNTNVVPTGDWGATTGTHPEINGLSYSMLMVVRYLLDHFATAQEACNWLEREAKIYAVKYSGQDIELHIMIADKDHTYIAEFLNNECHIINVDDRPYMTNFYVTDIEVDSNGHVIPETCTPHGAGLERYNLIADMYDSANTELGMKNVLRELRYTKMCERTTNPFWYTEYCGYTKTFGDLTVTTPREQFEGIIDYAINMYNHRSRDKQDPNFGTWQNVHNTVYNIEKKTLCLRVQEDYTKEYYYSFPVDCYVAGAGIKIENNVISSTGSVEVQWGSVLGDINDQEDLMLKFSDYYTKPQVDSKIAEIDLTSINEKLVELEAEDIVLQSNINTVDNKKYDKTEIDDKVIDLTTEIAKVDDKKYNKTEVDTKIFNITNTTYSKTQVDEFITDVDNRKYDKSDVDDMVSNLVDKDTYRDDMMGKVSKSALGKGNLTVNVNGVQSIKFNANATKDETLNLNIPLTTEELVNTSGFITIDDVHLEDFATKQELEDGLDTKANSTDVGHGILTLTSNGERVGTFSANASGNKTLDITVPTKISDLENDSPFVKDEELTPIKEEIEEIQTDLSVMNPKIQNLQSQVDNKVSKETGMGLISNEEIRRLANIQNYDDTEINERMDAVEYDIDRVDAKLDSKQNAIEGKGLSTNDFTTYYKDKIDTNNTKIKTVEDNMDQVIADVETISDKTEALKDRVDDVDIGLQDEIAVRQEKFNELQGQIDALSTKSSVVDVVADMQALEEYDTSILSPGDVVCVLKDDTHDNCVSYYKWTGVTFTWRGSEGKHYTKEESNNRFVSKEQKINGFVLSGDIELDAESVRALPEDTVYGGGVITIQVNGEELGRFSNIQTANKAIDITVPTVVSDLENDSKFVDEIALDDVYTTLNVKIDGVDYNLGIERDRITRVEDILSGGAGMLPRVALTGSYNDLFDKPLIPTNLSQLTNDGGYVHITGGETDLAELLRPYALIQQIPTKVSQVENDRGYLTTNSLGKGILTIKLGEEELGSFGANDINDVEIDIPLDNTLSVTSENPVQNKAITNELNTKAVDSTVVHKAQNETITGNKVFSGTVELNTATGITQNATDNSTKLATTEFVKQLDYCNNTNAVHKTGEEEISGNKEFTGDVTLSNATGITVTKTDNSNNLATTKFVKDQDYSTNTSVVHKDQTETISGNKTFTGTNTFTGQVNLGTNAHVTMGTSDDSVVNIKYVKDNCISSEKTYVEESTYNTKVGELTSSISGARTDLTSLETEVDTLTGNVETINTIVGNISTNVGNLNTTVSGHTTSINNISGDISEINTTLNELNTTVSTHTSTLTTINNEINSLKDRVTIIEQQIVNIIARLDRIDPPTE